MQNVSVNYLGMKGFHMNVGSDRCHTHCTAKLSEK